MIDQYTPYEGPSVANPNNRKLLVFDQKLGGSHFLFCSYFISNIKEQ